MVDPLGPEKNYCHDITVLHSVGVKHNTAEKQMAENGLFSVQLQPCVSETLESRG